MNIIPELVKIEQKETVKKPVIATIKADNEDCALSYFKGRFQVRGEVIDKLVGNKFRIRAIAGF